MGTAKEQIGEIIKRQPDDGSYDEIVRELAFELMVQRGLKDSDEGRTVKKDEMQRRIKTWQKQIGPTPATPSTSHESFAAFD